MNPVYIDELIADCVKATETKVLPQLQRANSNIAGVFFKHGHPLEIIAELQLLAKGPNSKDLRYPLVALFRDFPERKGTTVGVYAEARVNMIIATRTEPNYFTDQRKEVSFKPILYPILTEFMNQLYLSGKFFNEGIDTLDYTQIDHYFWGRQEIYGAAANIFKDWIDCIEIKDLILKPNTNC